MEIDVKALDMLPAAEESSLWPCVITCFVSCESSCLITI
ncbi:ALQxL family class IV lanthipeptide [Planotetraspora thailandica]|nr:ALQxL family class IV lanthipeptide [Planotetraspora thailandica]